MSIGDAIIHVFDGLVLLAVIAVLFGVFNR